MFNFVKELIFGKQEVSGKKEDNTQAVASPNQDDRNNIERQIDSRPNLNKNDIQEIKKYEEKQIDEITPVNKIINIQNITNQYTIIKTVNKVEQKVLVNNPIKSIKPIAAMRALPISEESILMKILSIFNKDELKDCCKNLSIKFLGNKEDLIGRLYEFYKGKPKKFLNDITKEELKDICDDLDLKVSGNKDELINRICMEVEFRIERKNRTGCS